MSRFKNDLAGKQFGILNINGKKDDNRIENLMLFDSPAAHTRHHQLAAKG